MTDLDPPPVHVPRGLWKTFRISEAPYQDACLHKLVSEASHGVHHGRLISLSFARLGQELALPEIPNGVSAILIGSIHTTKPLILQSRQSANGLYAILSLISPTWIYLWWPQVPPEVS